MPAARRSDDAQATRRGCYRSARCRRPFLHLRNHDRIFPRSGGQSGIAVIVLDRPNPINGRLFKARVSEPGRENFTNYGPIPVRHGMTLGELAQMFNAEHNIHAKLTVVPMQGWMRGDWFDSTGLEWMNPSPNLAQPD